MLSRLLFGVYILGVQTVVVLEYERLSDLDNFDCHETDIYPTFNARRVLECVNECSTQRQTCKSVFFVRNVDYSFCHLCTEGYDKEALQIQPSLPSCLDRSTIRRVRILPSGKCLV